MAGVGGTKALRTIQPKTAFLLDGSGEEGSDGSSMGEVGLDFQTGMLPPEMLDEMDGVGPS